MRRISSWSCRFISGPGCRLACRLGLVFVLLTLGVYQPAQPLSASRLEATPRLAIISAFAPEMQQLLGKTQAQQRYEINGRTFTTGRLAGHEVVLFLSGVSMVNAAMTTQLALDHFRITGIVFSGIAGGANPDRHIGDVVIPAEWAEYQEQVFARAVDQGWDTGYHPANLGHFGMMFPQPVTVTRLGGSLDSEQSKFWFSVDPQMLAVAQKSAAKVTLKRCPPVGPCLAQPPQVVVGGKGVSGPTFVDNAAYRQWVWDNFQASAVDMETAAVAHVAYTNTVPFLAFRSLSDLAGGGAGQNEMLIFMTLAADNSSAAVIAFLSEYESQKNATP